MSETKKGKDFSPKEKDKNEMIKEEKEKKKKEEKKGKKVDKNDRQNGESAMADCSCSSNNPSGV